MKTLTRGFTIVELLIVIVVIAILVSITVAGFSTMTARADYASRLSETQQWEKLIELYINDYGRLPMTGSTVFDTGTNDATYCLGTGFPDTDWRWGAWDTGSCRTLYPCGGDITCANEYQRGHVETSLNTELAKSGTLPKTGPRTLPNGEGALGPFVNFYSTTSMDLSNYYPVNTCPPGTVEFDRYPPAPNTKIVGCSKEFGL